MNFWMTADEKATVRKHGTHVEIIDKPNHFKVAFQKNGTPVEVEYNLGGDDCWFEELDDPAPTMRHVELPMKIITDMIKDVIVLATD